MKHFLLITMAVFATSFLIGQNSGDDIKKDMDQLRAKVTSLQNSNNNLNAKIKNLESRLSGQEKAGDSLNNILSSAGKKVDASNDSLVKIANKVIRMDRRMDSNSMRIHKGKIGLTVVLAIISLAVMLVFILLWMKIRSQAKLLRSALENNHAEIMTQLNSFGDKTDEKLREIKTKITADTADLNEKISKESAFIRSLTEDKITVITKETSLIKQEMAEFHPHIEGMIKNVSAETSGLIEKNEKSTADKMAMLADNVEKDITKLHKTTGELEKKLAGHEKISDKKLEEIKKQIDSHKHEGA
ncbi:MAG: hypothetical protein ABIJ16_09210 [Bacteroidota bacterium]